MAIAELLPKIHGLTRADKIRVLHFISSELSVEEEPSLVPDGEYAVWTPVGSEDAAAAMMALLTRTEQQPA
jgi:hypothetical protein